MSNSCDVINIMKLNKSNNKKRFPLSDLGKIFFGMENINITTEQYNKLEEKFELFTENEQIYVDINCQKNLRNNLIECLTIIFKLQIANNKFNCLPYNFYKLMKISGSEKYQMMINFIDKFLGYIFKPE